MVQPPDGWRTDHELLNMSNGYTECLDNALIIDNLGELSDDYSGLIGFTRRAGAHRPIIGELQQAIDQVVETQQPEKFGLVFGNERTGPLSSRTLSLRFSLYHLNNSRTGLSEPINGNWSCDVPTCASIGIHTAVCRWVGH